MALPQKVREYFYNQTGMHLRDITPETLPYLCTQHSIRFPEQETEQAERDLDKENLKLLNKLCQ